MKKKSIDAVRRGYSRQMWRNVSLKMECGVCGSGSEISLQRSVRRRLTVRTQTADDKCAEIER